MRKLFRQTPWDVWSVYLWWMGIASLCILLWRQGSGMRENHQVISVEHLLPLVRSDRWTAASGTTGGGRDRWSPEDVGWSAQPCPAVPHTCRRIYRIPVTKRILTFFGARESQPKPLFVPVGWWGTDRSDKLVPNLFWFTKQIVHPRKRTNDQVAGNPQKKWMVKIKEWESFSDYICTFPLEKPIFRGYVCFREARTKRWWQVTFLPPNIPPPEMAGLTIRAH